MQTFVADGEPDKPIAIVAAGEVVLDANGSDRHFNIAAADHLYFEGLTLRNTRIAFYCGLQGLEANTGLTVKNCKIENVQFGFTIKNGWKASKYPIFYLKICLNKIILRIFNSEGGVR